MKHYYALLALSLLTMSSAAMSAVITHTFDRDAVYSNVEMYRVLSTGETLADVIQPRRCHPPLLACESATGDILVTVTWADDTTFDAIWGYPSGKDLTDLSPVLFAGIEVPGISIFNDEYAVFVEQSGDTFFEPWEIRNLGTQDIREVVFSARGTPDMGFDTDDGDNPGHGAAGFLLYLDDTLSEWNGFLNVHYDWFNNWNGTTDMFHRMTLTFGENSLLLPNQSIVFYQDTDELKIPEPGTMALLGLGLVGLGLLGRRRS